MAASEMLYKNIDDDEKLIDEYLLKLEITGFYEELTNAIKEKYAELQSNYYSERLNAFNEFKEGLRTDVTIGTSSRYAVDIETDILEPLKEIIVLANCKQLIVSLDNSENIEIDDIINLMEKFNTASPKYKNEKDALYDEIGTLLYKLIKKEGLNDRFEIIDILYEYKDKGSNFITKVSRLFLEEVNEIFKKAKENSNEIFKMQNGRAIIELVKHATNDNFNKDDIINLLIATGQIKKQVSIETKDTKVFSETKQYSRTFYTKRKQIHVGDKGAISYYTMKRNEGVNPFPTNARENLKLREYDMTRVNLSIKDRLIRDDKYIYPNMRKYDYSYTNVVIIPKYMDITSLRGANLEGVDMRGVDLVGIDITDANLIGTGADITGTIGECIGVSPFEPDRVLVSKSLITPMEFERLTGFPPYAPYFLDDRRDKNFPWQNRVLRQYDLSCIDFDFDYICKAYKERIDTYYDDLVYNSSICHGLDFSYTNININPQQFTQKLVLNLEGVDLRDKDFSGKEKMFALCNLKGTGANISTKINPTVSEYIVPATRKVK